MSIRAWLLRRVMGRLQITDDVVRHLTSFQRLGETLEVQLPSELLPVGARWVFRAVRTRGAAQLGSDWVWPSWLERQLDPQSPAFIPRGHLPVLTNVTQRNWTTVGTLAARERAIVDPRGLVTPWFDGWSFDWWVGADDRWHFPSRETAVRQQLLDNTPVVVTSMRVPSGDVIQRVYATAGDEPAVVIEIENDSPVPVALAAAVRPYNPEGLAVVERIELHDTTVLVDGRPAILLPKRPQQMAASTFHAGDVAHAVVDGETSGSFPSDLRCDAGLAQAAFLFPLAHRATIRFAIPLTNARRTRVPTLKRRRIRSLDTPHAQPPADVVARGWKAQTERDMRLVLPAGRIADAVEAARRSLLLFHHGDEVTPGPYTYNRFWFRDAAYLLMAMDRFGFHAEAADVIGSFPGRQKADGFYFSQRQEWDANGAAIFSMAEHFRLTGDLSVVDTVSLIEGLRWIERTRQKRRRRNEPVLQGLMPPGISAEHLGPFDYFYWDDFWSMKGLVDGAFLLRALGEDEAAAQTDLAIGDFRRDLESSFTLVRERLGSDVLPAGPRRRIDAAIIGGLVACSPLGLYAHDHPMIAATAEEIRQRFVQDRAFFQAISHTGLGTYLTMQLASVELEAGDRRALDRLQWLVDAATSTFTWPEAIHPQLGGGCMGDGHHGWATADFLNFVRTMLVRESGSELVLCSMLPDAWAGQEVEAHKVPTHFGPVSFAIRYHGSRPALLWDLELRAGVDRPTRITAPGLDPAWSTDDLRGEALLASVGSSDSSSVDVESFS